MSISRRSFLKGAAAASLAVAASTVLAGCNGVTGGAGNGAYVSGSKTGTFTVDKKTITVNATAVEYVSVYDEMVPTFQVVNNTKLPVIVSSNKTNSGKYTLVPTVKYVGTSGQTLTVDYTKSTLDAQDIAVGKDATGTLVVSMKKLTDEEISWSAVQITLNLYDESGLEVADATPITFTFKK